MSRRRARKNKRRAAGVQMDKSKPEPVKPKREAIGQTIRDAFERVEVMR